MSGRRALFLDRDGVINVDHGYVCTPERTEFIDGIFRLCLAAKQADRLLVVITNQAGIGRGYYSEQQFLDYMGWMRAVFAQHGTPLDAVYYCPHHPTEGIGDYRRKCDCRKPAPGMLLRAQRDLNLDLARSTLVGDKESDVAAGHAAGVGCCIRIKPLPEPGVSSGLLITTADWQRILTGLADGR
ncbi:MAG: D-glycero-alpha-D-manno-heptose-1,7-bisphosphate 7-phosphatase [Rhodanobacter sp.]